MKKVLKLNHNGDLEIKEISTDLKSLQKEVGGYIEYVYPQCYKEHNISLMINEEGCFEDLKLSMILATKDSLTPLLGNVIFANNIEGEEGLETESLTDEQINYLMESLQNLFSVTYKGDKYLVPKMYW